jgi:hypothetical protein
VAIGWGFGEPQMIRQGSCFSSAPRIVDVNVNKNTKIFMTFGMPPLSKVEKSIKKYLTF